MTKKQRTIWKPSKPMSLADFVSGVGNFDGVTLFEELPGNAIIKTSTTSEKQDKKIVKSKKIAKSLSKKPGSSERPVKSAVVEDAGTAIVSEPTSRSRKKRKKRPACGVGAPAPAARSAPSEEDVLAAIESSGTDVSRWEALHVPPVLLAGLAQLGYHQPTEIQRLCLPAAIKGRMDVVGAAETGSGKTLAFALPLLYSLLKEREGGPDTAEGENCVGDADDAAEEEGHDVEPVTGPKALILAPTRELAIQVKNHIVAVAKYTGIKVVTVVGGMSEQKQQRLLSRRPEVVVATPGRLWEFVETGDPYLSNLTHLRCLVVDETDRMLEKGHFQQLHLLLERINADEERSARRQNFVFSATLMLGQEPAGRDFRQLKQLTTEQKLNHITSMVGIRQNNKKVVDISRQAGTAATLTEMAVSCTVPEKDELLYYFAMQHPGRTLVFCNSIDCVTRLGRLLTLLEMTPLLLHANMQQRQRLKSLQRFQTRRAAVLVATDVAARGLDVPGVQHVIHYQVPRTTDAYVHRSGRTARAQAEGLSVMFVEPAEAAAYRRLLRQLNRDSDLPPFSLDSDVLRSLSKHVTLARSINLAEHRQRRAAGSRSWRERAAREMDMELDDDLLPDEDGDAERRLQAELKTRRAQLREMLARRDQVWMPYTKHGRLEVPRRNVSALEVAKAGKEGRKRPAGTGGLPAEPTVAPPPDGGDGEKQPAAPPPAKKRKTAAAPGTGAEKNKPGSSAKRRRKKWFARKGK